MHLDTHFPRDPRGTFSTWDWQDYMWQADGFRGDFEGLEVKEEAGEEDEEYGTEDYFGSEDENSFRGGGPPPPPPPAAATCR